MFIVHIVYQVEGNVGEPVDGGDDVGEEDELGLVVGAGKLPGLEGVDGGAEDQYEGIRKACHNAESKVIR
jgi:hypothetical protein